MCYTEEVICYRSTSLIRKCPSPKDSPRTLGIGLRNDPRGVRFLISEVPLYGEHTSGTTLLVYFCLEAALLLYRVTSLIRKRSLLGPYHRPMPRALGGS